MDGGKGKFILSASSQPLFCQVTVGGCFRQRAVTVAVLLGKVPALVCAVRGNSSTVHNTSLDHTYLPLPYITQYSTRLVPESATAVKIPSPNL